MEKFETKRKFSPFYKTWLENKNNVILVHLWWRFQKFTHDQFQVFIEHPNSLRTLHACCSQSTYRILKICESTLRALFLYNCTPNISHSADTSVSVT